MEDLDHSGESNDIQVKFGNRNKSRASVSLFDLVIEVVPPDKVQKTEYEENLTKEAKDWNNLLKEKIQDFEKIEKDKRQVHKNVLTETQRSYLDQMPDLQKFLKESNEFCTAAYKYLRDNEEIVEMHDQLMQYCKAPLDNVASDIVHECIYSHRT